MLKQALASHFTLQAATIILVNGMQVFASNTHHLKQIQNGIKMKTNDQLYPGWQTQKFFVNNPQVLQGIEYKYVLRNDDLSTIKWEQKEKRQSGELIGHNQCINRVVNLSQYFDKNQVNEVTVTDYAFNDFREPQIDIQCKNIIDRQSDFKVSPSSQKSSFFSVDTAKLDAEQIQKIQYFNFETIQKEENVPQITQFPNECFDQSQMNNDSQNTFQKQEVEEENENNKNSQEDQPKSQNQNQSFERIQQSLEQKCAYFEERGSQEKVLFTNDLEKNKLIEIQIRKQLEDQQINFNYL